MSIESIRALVRDNPRTSDGYPRCVRDAVGAYGRTRRAAGVTWAALEDEVGISCTSIRSWMRALQRGSFHEVVVVDDPAIEVIEGAGIAITSPSGFVLSGCTLEQATWVLRSLR